MGKDCNQGPTMSFVPALAVRNPCLALYFVTLSRGLNNKNLTSLARAEACFLVSREHVVDKDRAVRRGIVIAGGRVPSVEER